MTPSFDDIFKKFKKRQVLTMNRFQGKQAENSFVIKHQLAGDTVERTGRGHDYKVTKRDFFTGKPKGTTFHEVKSSRTAPISKLQKRMKRKLKGKYQIDRPQSWW